MCCLVLRSNFALLLTIQFASLFLFIYFFFFSATILSGPYLWNRYSQRLQIECAVWSCGLILHCCLPSNSLCCFFLFFPPQFCPGYFKNTKNLFIHIALIPEGDNPRVNPNILKCLLHSPVAKGYRLVVIASRAMVCKTPTHYLILNSLAFARGCVILRSHILFPLLLILLISHHI